MKNLIASLIIGTLLLNSSSAQKTDLSGISEYKKWSIAAKIGWSFGGPSIKMQEAMDKYGYGDDQHNALSGQAKVYPYTNHSMPSGIISCKYKFNPIMAIGMDMGITDHGNTEGAFDIDMYWASDEITIEYSSLHFSPTFSYIPTVNFIIGFGPSIYFTKAWQNYDMTTGTEVENKNTKLGFLIDLEVRVPKKSLMFFEINSQYRYVGKAIIGPFNNESGETKVIPETEVNYSHLIVGFGIGFRFRKAHN
jgi:hypothetical protein